MSKSIDRDQTDSAVRVYILKSNKTIYTIEPEMYFLMEAVEDNTSLIRT